MANSTDFGLDTSVVLRLLLGEPAEQSRSAVAALSRARREGRAVLVSDLVTMEAYFALHSFYNVPKRESLAALSRMFESDLVLPEPGGCAPAALAECRRAPSKPGFVDRLIHAQYASHGARLLSFEKAARKLPGGETL